MLKPREEAGCGSINTRKEVRQFSPRHIGTGNTYPTDPRGLILIFNLHGLGASNNSDGRKWLLSRRDRRHNSVRRETRKKDKLIRFPHASNTLVQSLIISPSIHTKPLINKQTSSFFPLEYGTAPTTIFGRTCHTLPPSV